MILLLKFTDLHLININDVLQKSEPSPEMSVAAPTVVASTVEVTSSDVDQSVNEPPRSSEVQDEKSNTASKETKPTHETAPRFVL